MPLPKGDKVAGEGHHGKSAAGDKARRVADGALSLDDYIWRLPFSWKVGNVRWKGERISPCHDIQKRRQQLQNDRKQERLNGPDWPTRIKVPIPLLHFWHRLMQRRQRGWTIHLAKRQTHPSWRCVQGVRVRAQEWMCRAKFPWDLQQGQQIPGMDPQTLQVWKLLETISYLYSWHFPLKPTQRYILLLE